jgi:hypothetical protein
LLHETPPQCAWGGWHSGQYHPSRTKRSESVHPMFLDLCTITLTIPPPPQLGKKQVTCQMTRTSSLTPPHQQPPLWLPPNFCSSNPCANTKKSYHWECLQCPLLLLHTRPESKCYSKSNLTHTRSNTTTTPYRLQFNSNGQLQTHHLEVARCSNQTCQHDTRLQPNPKLAKLSGPVEGTFQSSSVPSLIYEQPGSSSASFPFWTITLLICLMDQDH